MELLAWLMGVTLTYWVVSRYYVWRHEEVMKQRRLVTSGFVYYVQYQQGKQLLVKIGRSIDPIKRIRSLRTSVPGGLKVLGIFPVTDDKKTEAYIHKKFAHLRVNKSQEWFRLSVPLLLYINATSDPITTAVVRKAVELK